MSVIPRSRPHRDRAAIDAVLKHCGIPQTEASLVFIRGYYLNTLGEQGKNDYNVYDDACFLIGPHGYDSYNANTDPSFVKKGSKALAKLDLGVYKFYRGLHRGKYKALRAFPEGVRLPCTRAGEKSMCSHINIHKGGLNNGSAGVTWSEGCLTIPSPQYEEWRSRVWDAMSRNSQDQITVVLIENRLAANGTQQLFDWQGRVI